MDPALNGETDAMSDPAVAISLTRYNQPDWVVRDALRSLAGQVGVRARVLFLDQNRSAETERDCHDFSSANVNFEYVVIPQKSLSFARNRAIEMSETDVLLFIDDDAVADAHWAARLSATVNAPGIAAASGKIIPQWHGRPLWVSRSRLVREQYSLLDLGPLEIGAKKVIGANFGINLRLAAEEAYFDETLGRVAGTLRGGEEIDFSERLVRKGHRIAYNGSAIVRHQILPERLRYRWLARRFYHAGRSRAQRGGPPSPTHQMGPWDIVAASIFAVPYLSGFLRGKIHDRVH